jgi:lipopolysaccharide export system protein LptA
MIATRRAAWLLGLMLLATAPLAAAEVEGLDFLDRLAGPGGNMRMSIGKLPDGTGGNSLLFLNADGSIGSLEIPGKVRLRSERLNLDSLYLRYDPKEGVLIARGEVLISQDGVEARAEELRINLRTNEMVFTGKPSVVQDSPEQSATFSGMEVLTIEPGEAGRVQVVMRGGEEIVGRIRQGAANGDTTTTGVVTALPSGSDFSRNINVSTRARGASKPVMRLNLAEGGAFDVFRADGKVLLENEGLRLVSDVLEYSGPAQRVEALYNVYVSTGRVTADCGRFVYDLARDVITLSVNPDIREQRRPGSVMRIFDIAEYIITRNPDGTIATETVADPTKEQQLVLESTDPGTSSTPPRPPAEPLEIQLDDPASLNSVPRR